jgi:predicted ribosome quality control (RQC) complex YloA/Tae2 family protein
MKDTLTHGYRDFRETVALKWGRHFRVNERFKIILGRDEEESISLIRYAHSNDHIMHLPTNDGPVAIIKGENPDASVLSIAAGLIQRFSKYREQAPLQVQYFKSEDKNVIRQIAAIGVSDVEFDRMKL